MTPSLLHKSFFTYRIHEVPAETSVEWMKLRSHPVLAIALRGRRLATWGKTTLPNFGELGRFSLKSSRT